MKKNAILIGIISISLLTGIFVYQESTNPGGLFYQSSNSYTIIAQDGTTVAGNFEATPQEKEELVQFFSRQEELSQKILQEFEVDSQVIIGEFEGKTLVNVALYDENFSDIEALEAYMITQMPEWENLEVHVALPQPDMGESS